MALKLGDLTAWIIGAAIEVRWRLGAGFLESLQHGLLLNFAKAHSNPIASVLLQAVPALLPSSFRMIVLLPESATDSKNERKAALREFRTVFVSRGRGGLALPESRKIVQPA